jgi:type II secretory pathway pseudopilin PulG
MHNRGYTLLETLVIIAIIGILFPAIFLTIRSLYDTHQSTLARSMALHHGTKTLHEIVNDIRSASYSESGALPIATIGTSTIVMYSDTDFDRHTERIRYTLTDTTLEKGMIEPNASRQYMLGDETVDTVLRNVQNNTSGTITFRYYDALGNELAPTPENTLAVKRVSVSLDVQGVFSGAEVVTSVSGSASVRNLKYIY